MTRKRYIKLLMSHGVSRNQANNAALFVVLCGTSYAKDYKVSEILRKLGEEAF